jgi:hypothetical protein
MLKAIQVCEGEYEGTVKFKNAELLKAYSDGFSAGAGKYGAGTAAVYDRRDLDSLDAKFEFDAKTIALINKHLPE